jgi:hypothetical protein
MLPLSEHGTRLPDQGHPVNLILQTKKNIEGYYEYPSKKKNDPSGIPGQISGNAGRQ